MTPKTLIPIDLSECKRRFEKRLVLKGYSMTGVWTVREGQKPHDTIYSMSLKGLPDTRAVMWREKTDQWVAMISIAVGEDGEFPITGGVITRHNMDKWPLKSFAQVKSRIDEIRQQIRMWDRRPVDELGNIALINLALSYLRDMKIKTAISVLLTAVRGEISTASVSESLSIVQMKFGRTREERLRSALIWGGAFK